MHYIDGYMYLYIASYYKFHLPTKCRIYIQYYFKPDIPLFLLGCVNNTYGPDCAFNCTCLNGATECSPVTGVCNCTEGYTGSSCESGTLVALRLL